MYKLACENPDKYRYDLKFMKRLSFRKSFKSPTGYIVKIRPNILSKYTYNCYFLLLTNEIKDPTVALNIYRNRNAVEEAFNRLKNSLELKRMRVHSDIASQSKLFIEFLSLIIISKIHYVMERENLYKDYTMFELLKEINKQHVLEINNFRIVSPAHYRQKLIFNKFNCPLISEIFLGPEPVLNVV
jgi:transposase